MSDEHYLQRFPAARPGPYGTNEGDLWSCEDSPVGKTIAEKHNGVLIAEMMMKDGALQECMYWTQNLAMIAAARAGLVKYIEATAARLARLN